MVSNTIQKKKEDALKRRQAIKDKRKGTEEASAKQDIFGNDGNDFDEPDDNHEDAHTPDDTANDIEKNQPSTQPPQDDIDDRPKRRKLTGKQKYTRTAEQAASIKESR